MKINRENCHGCILAPEICGAIYFLADTHSKAIRKQYIDIESNFERQIVTALLKLIDKQHYFKSFHNCNPIIIRLKYNHVRCLLKDNMLE